MTAMTSNGLRPLTAEQELQFQAWRAKALDSDADSTGMPYMASMLFSLRPMNAPGLGTFAVDAHHRLYIDFEAVAEKGVRWCAEALLHECCHLFADHAGRATDMAVADHERMVSNIAADAEINDDLEDAGCDMSDAVLPEKIGADRHDTYEVYLTILRKQQQQQQQQQQGQQGGQGQSQQSGQGGQGQDQDQGQGGGSQPGPFRGCGSGSGGQAAPCELPGDDDADGNAPGASTAEKERAQIATAAAIRQHAASGRGTMPAGLVERAEALLAPSKVPWRRVLSASIRRALGAKYGDFDVCYTRRSRRQAGGRSGIIMPGTFTPTPTLAVVRDTSGSMGGDEIQQVTIEVEAIAKQLGIRGKELRVVDVDAAVHAVRDYKGASTLTEVSGRGGTDMCVGIAFAEEMKPRPTAVVVISDGGTPWPEQKNLLPVIACLVGPYAETGAPYVPDWISTVVVDD